MRREAARGQAIAAPSLQLNRTGFPGGDVVWFLRRQGGVLQVVVVAGFGLGRRDVADGLEEGSRHESGLIVRFA